ncbi:MAG TPA: ABC transporter permease subunit/CPBP intramembrane protease [Polyangia bacterium]
MNRSTRDVRVVWAKELRETLRDRRTLGIMLLFPLVVYPLMALLMTEVIAGKEAAQGTRPSRVAVVGGAPEARETVRALLRSLPPGVRPGIPSASAAKATDGGFEVAAERDGEARDAKASRSARTAEVTAGALDAVVDVDPENVPAPNPLGDLLGLPPQPRPLQVVYDETRPASDQAHDRLALALGSVLPVGCAPTFAVTATSVASKTKVGGYVLSKVLPLIVIIMTMLGAFYPAIDITAGERERGTLETLLASPVRRFDLMTGKVLAVTTLATLTGALNIVSMSLTVAETAKLAGGATAALSIPWTRAVATLLVVAPAAFLFGSVMVAIGAMARGFKEAQSLLMPVYLLCLTPSLATTAGDFPLSGVTMVIPGTNLTLLARDLMLGDARLLPAAITLLSTLAFGAGALAFAARLYDSERLLTSTDSEHVGIGAWLRHLLGRAPRGSSTSAAPAPSPTTAGQALALFGIAFVLWFFVFTWLQHWRLLPGLLISQWGGFLGLVWLFARVTRRPLAEVVVFRAPRAAAVAGALCIGMSCWIILGILADRLMPPPKEVVENIRRLIRPPGEDRPLWLSIFALGVTPAICEEALFRGPILRGLRNQLPAGLACALTGILFGVLHGDVWRFVPTALLGTLLSWMALTSGSIVPSMVSHIVNNGTLIVLGYYGLDEAGEKLSSRANLLLAGGAVILLVAGIAAVRAGRQPLSRETSSVSRVT